MRAARAPVRIAFAPVLRRLLFGSLAIAPVAIALHYVADLDETTEFVVSAIALIPLAWLIGEATEHAAEIALSSAAQVAVFLIPAVALLSWLPGLEPLALSFRQVEILALGGSVAVAAVVLRNGRSSRLKGFALLAAYAGVVVAFYAAGDRGA